MEKVAVGTGADLVDDIGLEIAVDGARNIFALAYSTSNNDGISLVKLSIEHHVAFATYFSVMGITSRAKRIHLAWVICVPVSEKKVLKPWSGSWALRSSVR